MVTMLCCSMQVAQAQIALSHVLSSLPWSHHLSPILSQCHDPAEALAAKTVAAYTFWKLGSIIASCNMILQCFLQPSA